MPTAIRCLLILLLLPIWASAEELRWDAHTLFARGAVVGLQRIGEERATSGITLQRGVLIEDDGPAAGFSYKPQEEKLSAGVRLRKRLADVDPRAEAATLLAAPGGKLEFVINGAPAVLEPLGKQGNYWQAYRLDPALLKKGVNTVEMGGTGSLWIARDDEYLAGSLTRTLHPNRSAKSSDGGKSWNDAKLGTAGDCDGEYLVRLHLDQYQSTGRLTLPVIDARDLAGNGWPLADGVFGRMAVQVEADLPPGTAVVVRARTGKLIDLELRDTWSAWKTLPIGGGSLAGSGPFVQFDIELATDNPLVSPTLKALQITALTTEIKPWLQNYRLVGERRPQIVRTGIPFRYEPFDRPELRALREKYGLDEVVAGAKTEWELIRRLSAWSATRWEKGHLKEIYPAWNALEILKPHSDGTPIGGFCQQYNLVFLQACESFGLVGRIVSIGPGGVGEKIRSGHETAEIWSNEFEKWVHIDGNTAWYFVDAGKQEPLSLLELRDRQLAALAGREHPAVEVRITAETHWKWEGLTGWPAFAEQRLIPRSNFLAERIPLPLNQGMRGWFWTGHHLWSDSQAPRSLLFSQVEERRENISWTLNQTEFALLPRSDEALVVSLATVTPGFEAYLAQFDGQPLQAVQDGFVWKLHPGRNRLDVRTRNTAGRLGPVSWIELERK